MIRRSECLPLLSILILSSVDIHAQVAAPVLVQKVEPQYPTSGVTVVDPARVTMIIDTKGSPIALSSYASLPDSVVQALSAWRFNPGTKDGKKTVSSVIATVPIRRSADFYATVLHRPASTAYEFSQSPTGTQLDAHQAAELQKKLKDNLSSIDSRRALLWYSAPETTTEMSEIHFNQLEWLIQKAPDYGGLASPPAMLDRSTEPGRARYEKLRRLWLEQLSAQPDNDAILANATYFLRLGDPEKAEQLLLATMPKVSGTGSWLGELYAYSMLGVTKLDAWSGLPVQSDSNALDTPRAQDAHTKLMTSRDLRVLLPALRSLSMSMRALAGSNPTPARFTSLCEGFLNYVRTIYPDTTESCGGPPISNGGKPEPARLIQKITPVYPPSAKAAGLQGEVHFSALIGTNGTILNLGLLSGGLIFYESARAAILQWRYEPTKLNGEPVEVVTQIDVNYTLQ